jgi:hypothetical protein
VAHGTRQNVPRTIAGGLLPPDVLTSKLQVGPLGTTGSGSATQLGVISASAGTTGAAGPAAAATSAASVGTPATAAAIVINTARADTCQAFTPISLAATESG